MATPQHVPQTHPPSGHEAEVEAARKLDRRTLLDRLRITDFRVDGFIATEVLVTLYREARFSGDRDFENQLAGPLSHRLERLACNSLREYAGNRGWVRDLNDDAHELALRVYELLASDSARALHAERRFGQFFQRQAIDYVRYIAADKRSKVVNQTDTEAADAEPESLDEIADPNARDVEDIEEQLAKRDMSDKLSAACREVLDDNEFQVIQLHYYADLPIESDSPTAPSVARSMKKSGRMIRNYKTRALEKLSKELTK